MNKKSVWTALESTKNDQLYLKYDINDFNRFHQTNKQREKNDEMYNENKNNNDDD